MDDDATATTRDAGDDVADLYLGLRWEGPQGRPAVAIGMVASLDGAAVVEGGSGKLGGDADLVAFRRLREAADAVMVAAGTVRAEDYGASTLRQEEARQRRAASGRSPEPLLAIVTSSASLDPRSRVFSDLAHRPLIVTCSEVPRDNLARLVPEHADVVFAGGDRVDLAGALHELDRRGCRQVLVEGGPSLNAQLFAADLVDEVFVTVAPWIVGQTTHRIVEGALGDPVRLERVGTVSAGDEVLLRYRVRGR